MSKRTRFLLGIGVIAALVLGFQIVAFASHIPPTLEGSTFEIDDDANLKVDHPSGTVDWATPESATFHEIRGVDKPTGATDDSYKGGVKEDTVCPGQTTGSIPNNKSDLRTFHVNEEAGTGGHPGFLNMGWSRVTDPSGTTLMDFEFNQSSTTCPAATGSPNVLRTQDDLLIEYLIDQGGARAEITGRFWQGNATSGQWGPPISLTDPNPLCPDANGDPAPCAAGTINRTPIPAAESDGIISSGSMAARTFGEAQIDLRLLFQEDECVSFGSAMLKSRSSDSFTSQPKDFIAPVPIDIQNCGTVIIHKETNPDTDPTTGPEFKYSGAFNTDADPDTPPPPPQTFSLRDEGTKTYTNVLFGNDYTVEELLGAANLPAGGWEFANVNCENNEDNPDANVTPDSIVGAVVTFDINSADDVLECTYTNQQRVSTLTTTQSVFPNDTASVTGTLGTPTGDVTFELYGPSATANCTDNLRYSQTVALASGSASTTNGDGLPAPNPPDFAVNAGNEGTYWWKVSYAGDANNPPVSGCTEKTVVDIENGQPVSSG